MFKKVLIAEDLGSINYGIAQVLTEKIGVSNIQNTQYCDDAYLKTRKAIQDGEPYDLLITDLSFKESHRERKISTGVELIEAIRDLQPNIKVIVYSMEDRPTKVKELFKKKSINGYVCKGRYGLVELVKSVREVYKDYTYLSPQLTYTINKNSSFELEDYDIMLLQYLSKGLTQEEIAKYFRANRIRPSSTSSIEKRLNKLKFNFKAKNAVHLVSMTKDLGLL